MKNLLILFVFISGFQTIIAQESQNSFIEANFGVALMDDFNYVPMPGTSELWGKTHIYDNDFIFEYEGGFAFPTLLTGKLGIGKKFNTTQVVIGVRPFPFHLYAQSSFAAGEKGYWITSIEYNPLNSDNSLLGNSVILNFGYRWSLNLKE